MILLQTHKLFFAEFRDTVSEFVGLPIFLEYSDEGNLVDVKIEDIEKDLYEANKKNIEAIIEAVKRVLINFYDNHQNLGFRPYGSRLLQNRSSYRAKVKRG